jgi:hypothetical protein
VVREPTLESTCPVCEAPLAGASEHCSRCGFPSVLRDRLDGPIPSPVEEESDAAATPVFGGPRVGEPPAPESELNATLARGLGERMELLRPIDRDAPDVTGEMCEAALSEASGRLTEAQQILRSAQARLDRETEELLGRHVEGLKSRVQRLASSGLRVAFDDELGRLADAVATEAPATAVAAVASSEHRLEAIEAHWRGLQGLIAQVEMLREAAAELGLPAARTPDRLARAREQLAASPATERELDTAAQIAAETLMQLHEAIPPALERELATHAGTLEHHAARRPQRAQAARRHHVDAVRHLRSGRLEDAVRSVRELRLALEELARAAEEPSTPSPEPKQAPVVAPPSAASAPPPPAAGPPAPSVRRLPPAPPPSPPGEATPPPSPPPAPAAPARAVPDAATVDTLMKKARSLAVRVRALPPESEQAAAAAREIHEATQLLRAGRYAEADAALSRLMRALATAPPRV